MVKRHSIEKPDLLHHRIHAHRGDISTTKEGEEGGYLEAKHTQEEFGRCHHRRGFFPKLDMGSRENLFERNFRPESRSMLFLVITE